MTRYGTSPSIPLTVQVGTASGSRPWTRRSASGRMACRSGRSWCVWAPAAPGGSCASTLCSAARTDPRRGLGRSADSDWPDDEHNKSTYAYINPHPAGGGEVGDNSKTTAVHLGFMAHRHRWSFYNHVWTRNLPHLVWLQFDISPHEASENQLRACLEKKYKRYATSFWVDRREYLIAHRT